MPRKRKELSDVANALPQLRQMLELVHQGTGLSLSALQEQTTVERRKLKQILEGENVSLTLYELQCLDAFLAGKGLGLFSKKALPQLMAELGIVWCLVPVSGDKDERGKATLSLWDVQAMSRIRELLSWNLLETYVIRKDRRRSGRDGKTDDEIPVVHRSRNVAFEFHPVQSHEPLGGGDAMQRLEQQITGLRRPDDDSSLTSILPATGEPDEQPPGAVVSLGSPRASVASELMLRRMFCLQDEDRTRRPFTFVWHHPTSLDRGSWFTQSISRFDLTGLSVASSHVSRSDVESFVKNRSASFFVVGNEVFPTWANRRSADGSHAAWPSCALVAVQRRARQLWVVCAGLTGPDTLAASTLLAEFAPSLVPWKPVPPNGHDEGRVRDDDLSCVVWWVVETQLAGEFARESGDRRRIVQRKVIRGPNIFWPR